MIAADLLIQQRAALGRPCTLISKATVGELLAIVFDVQPFEDGAVNVRERRWAVGPADDKSQITPTGGLVSRRLEPIRETTRAGGLRRLASRPDRTTATEQEEA